MKGELSTNELILALAFIYLMAYVIKLMFNHVKDKK